MNTSTEFVASEASVAELQSKLTDLGYYDGPIDGQPRPETDAALRKFQTDHGLGVTGRLDARTLRTMYESYCY